MSSNVLTADARAAYVLWRREVMKFFKHASRIAGAVAQPLIFWLVLGAGLGSSFQAPGAAAASDVSYLEYFYPGVLVMMLLFSAIFGTMSVIEDRNEGFLQAVLVAAASRLALVTGKVSGSATVALMQTGLFLCFVPWAGFPPAAVNWPLLIAALVLGSIGLTALGFCLAWWLDSAQAYHALMSVLLIPAWLLSGALFPANNAHGAIVTIMRFNPMAYMVELIRRALYGATPPTHATLGLPGSTVTLELMVVAGFALASVALATALCSRRS